MIYPLRILQDENKKQTNNACSILKRSSKYRTLFGGGGGGGGGRYITIQIINFQVELSNLRQIDVYNISHL